jgi:hypothetical protein
LQEGPLLLRLSLAPLSRWMAWHEDCLILRF